MLSLPPLLSVYNNDLQAIHAKTKTGNLQFFLEGTMISEAWRAFVRVCQEDGCKILQSTQIAVC